MNDKELFENLCLSPSWQEADDNVEESPVYIRQSKDLTTLLSELEEIKEHLQAVKEKEWHLANLMRFHKEGFVK